MVQLSAALGCALVGYVVLKVFVAAYTEYDMRHQIALRAERVRRDAGRR